MRRLKSTFSQPKYVLLVFLVLAVLFFISRELTVFALVILGAAALEFLSYKPEIKVSFGHVFFLSIITAKSLGVVEALLLLLLAESLPRIIMAEIDMKAVIITPVEAIFVLAAPAVFDGAIGTGLLLASLYFLIYFLAAKFSGDSLVEIVAEVGFPYLLNIMYFVSMAAPVTRLLGYVIAA